MATSSSSDKLVDDVNLETFGLLWLDSDVHNSEENREAQHQIRSSINHVVPFEEPNSCENYIRSISPHDRLVLIISGRLGQTVVPNIHHIRQVSSIYVYCMDKTKHSTWAKNYTKVKAVAVDLHELIFKIKTDQKKRVKIEDPIVINFFKANSNVEQSTTGLNGQFVHSQLLIDVLLRLKSSETDKQELIELCAKQYKGNETELAILREFKKNYSANEALWWYSRESFLYRMLNKALRVQNIDLLFLFRFIMLDIYRELKRNQCRSPMRVYRGQVLSTNELNHLRQSVGQFISVNSFFSTSVSRHAAMEFLNECDISNDLHRVLFGIDADPKVVTTKPFADISSFAEHAHEAEVLFMTGAIFRVKSIRKDDQQIWIVQLTLCGDDEHELNDLFEYLKKSYGGDDDASLFEFGRVLHRMGKYDSAEKFYRQLLNQISSDDMLLSSLYYSLGFVLKDKHDLDASLYYIQKSLQIKLHLFTNEYKNICDCYNELGTLHGMKGNLDAALAWYQKGMKLLEQENDTDSLMMAHFYNNIAIIYEQQKKYSDALEFNHIALSIRQEHQPPNHPDIGLVHNNVGSIYCHLGEYNNALKHHCQGLNIRIQSLPSNHPHVAQSYENVGLDYENLGDLPKALEHLEKAAAIYRQTLFAEDEVRVNIEKHVKCVSRKLK